MNEVCDRCGREYLTARYQYRDSGVIHVATSRIDPKDGLVLGDGWHQLCPDCLEEFGAAFEQFMEGEAMQGKTKLRECPFCGGEHAEVIDEHQEFLEQAGVDYDDIDCSGFRSVVCNVNSGGCGASSGWKPTEDDAVEAWNMRTERSCEMLPTHSDLEITLTSMNTGITRAWGYRQCSNCLCNVFEGAKYCPNCGARVVSE